MSQWKNKAATLTIVVCHEDDTNYSLTISMLKY
jgi:hypothetical protein